MFGLAVVAAALAACRADLTETATNFISPDQFYHTDEQAQIAVNAIYAPLMDWNGWKQPAQHSIMCDDDEMNCESWMGGGENGQIQGQWFADGNSVWFGDYQIIERANEVLGYVGNSTGVSAAAKQKAIGQAKFGRAYAYFDLVRRFGAVPLRTTMYKPDATLGAAARSPIDSVYAVITKDLLDAAAALPAAFDPSTGQGLPRAAAAWGLLAKVYLHMAGAEVAGTPLAQKKNAYLDSAVIAAQKVMQDGSVALEQRYMDLFDVDKQGASHEILFAVQGSRSNGSNVVPFFAPAGDCTLSGGCGPAGPGFVTLRNDFVKSFDPADKRMEPGTATPLAWLAQTASQSTYHGRDRLVIHRDSLAKLYQAGLVLDTTFVAGDGWTQGCEVNRLFPGFYAIHYRQNASSPVVADTVALPYAYYTLKYVDRGNNGSQYGNKNNFIILRYADVLLVLAEAENERNGPTGLATSAVNLVRTRAGLPALPVLTQAQFRDSVRVERRHELYAEFQRSFDLRRYGTYVEEMNRSVSSALYSGQVCRPRQAYQVLQPIPTGELAANPLMKQNTGY
jgi:voltage-gated potassium channel Kch